MCVQGARWVQEKLLDANAEEKFRMIVIWEPMLPSDGGSRMKPSILDDERLVQYWDQERVSGKWYTANAKDCRTLGAVAWDAFYVYGAQGKWDDVAAKPIACGTPVIQAKTELAEAFEKMKVGSGAE